MTKGAKTPQLSPSGMWCFKFAFSPTIYYSCLTGSGVPEILILVLGIPGLVIWLTPGEANQVRGSSNRVGQIRTQSQVDGVLSPVSTEKRTKILVRNDLS